MKDHGKHLLKRCLLGLGLWAGVALGAGAADTPAVVTQVRGAALLAQHQLELLDPLKPGDTIEVAAGAELVVFRPAQLQQLTLTGPARFVVNDDGVARQSGSGSVRLERQDPAFARVLSSSDRAIAGAIVRGAVDPNGTIDPERIAPSMPVLAWRTQAHLGEWRLRLLDDADRTVFDAAVAHTELSLPDSVRLVPEHRYRRELRWQRRDGSVQLASVPLQALSAAEDAQLMRLLPPDDAPLAARVLFALYLRHLGVRSLAAQIAPEINDLTLPR